MRFVAFILILFCFLCTSAGAGEIYEWIDENGVKHFSNEPPPKGAKIVKEAEEIESDQASDQKPVPKGSGTLTEDAQVQESSADQAVSAESSGSDDSNGDDKVDSGIRPKEAVRRHEKRKAEREAKPEFRGDITDKDEEANLGDPDEKANMDDPDEKSSIGDPDEKKNIGDPDEKRDFEEEKF